ARETGYSSAWTWTTSGGTPPSSIASQKCSATWTNTASNNNPPYANGIHLVANNRYYVELNQQEGTGGDNAEMAMVPHSFSVVDGTDYAPKDNLIGINAPKANWVAFTVQPTNPPAVSPGLTNSVTFYAFGTTDSQLAVGSIRANNAANN